VPAVEIKPDVKVKKPKPEGAAAPAAEQPKKVANKEAVVADKAKAEQRSENAEAMKVDGAKKGKGEKKEKVKKEPKPAAPAPVVEAPAPWMVDLRVGKIIDGSSKLSVQLASLSLRISSCFREQSSFTLMPTRSTSRLSTSENPNPEPSFPVS